MDDDKITELVGALIAIPVVVGIILGLGWLSSGMESIGERQRQGEKAVERLDKFSQEIGYQNWEQLDGEIKKYE
jgi:hypothetical protein